MDTEKLRQCRHNDAKLTETEMPATRDAYRVTNQQTMAARRALEWIKRQRPVCF